MLPSSTLRNLVEKNDVGGLSPQSQSDKPRVWAEPSVTIPTTSANAEISHFILSEILTEDQFGYNNKWIETVDKHNLSSRAMKDGLEKK